MATRAPLSCAREMSSAPTKNQMPASARKCLVRAMVFSAMFRGLGSWRAGSAIMSEDDVPGTSRWSAVPSSTKHANTTAAYAPPPEPRDAGPPPPAVEPKTVEPPVRKEREPGKVPGVLQEGEQDVERDHQGKQDAQQVRHCHGQHPEFA